MRRSVGHIVVAATVSGFAALFMSLGATAGAQSELRPPDTADPTTQLPEHRMTSDDLERLKRELTNWGRWGRDDERGTLNLITPQKTQAAARLIKDGLVVSLAHFAYHDKALDAGGTEL